MARPPLEIPGPLGTSRRSRWIAGVRRRTYPAVALLGEVVPRAIDIAVSASVLVLLSPVMLMRGLWSRRQTGSVLTRSMLIGRYQTPFRRVSFSGSGRLRFSSAKLLCDPGRKLEGFMLSGDQQLDAPMAKRRFGGAPR